MSQTSLDATTGPSSATHDPTDLRRAARLLAAVVLPIGPAAVAVLRFILPYDTTDSGREIVRQIAAHPDRSNAAVWLGFVAVLTLAPAVIWVGRVTARTAPRLTAAALLLLVPAYLTISFVVASDAIGLYAVQHGVPTATAGDMYTSVHPAVGVAGVVFVIGHVLGTILLGTALIRSRVVPLWAGIAVVVAQPIHFVAAVVVTNHPLDLIGWGLNAVGFAAVSVAIVRMRDDDWALRPSAR